MIRAVSATDVERGGLAEFAKAHGLGPADTSKLPTDGGLLGHSDLRVGAAVAGALPGGEPGALCHLTYTYRSDDTTHTVERTAAILRVPESIGFAPYLGSAAVGGAPWRRVQVRELDGGAKVRVAEGVNDAWLTELFSPAFSEWLARSPDDFDWELANGVLCASRRGHLTADADLARLCSDAAHIATTIREECLEEVDSGEAKRSAAKTPKAKRQDVLVNSILERTTFDHPPADVSSSRPQFRHVVTSHPATYLNALFRTLLWMIAVNVIGGGIYGLLLNLPNPGQAVLIYQAFLFVVIGFFVLRSQINGTSREARGRGLLAAVRPRAQPDLRGPFDLRRHPCEGEPARHAQARADRRLRGRPGVAHGHRRRAQARRLDRPGRRRDRPDRDRGPRLLGAGRLRRGARRLRRAARGSAAGRRASARAA